MPTCYSKLFTKIWLNTCIWLGDYGKWWFLTGWKYNDILIIWRSEKSPFTYSVDEQEL